MSESDGNTELTGLARSIDALFSRNTEADAPSTLAAETASEEHDSGLAAAALGAAGGAAMLLDDPWSDDATRDGDAEEAVVDEVLSEAVLSEEVGVEEALFEETVAEDVFVDEAFGDEAVVDEPLFEGALVEDAVVEDAFFEAPMVEEAVAEDAVVEETFFEAPMVEEAVVEDSIAEADEAADEEFVEGPLDIAVGTYLGGDFDRASEIESLAAELMSGRDIAPITRAVMALTLAAGDPPDASVYAVAESIMDPVVLGLLARQMGAERVEERRHEYYSVCRTIGDEMAVAVRNDLAETTDRLARRIHCEALVEMGPSGRRMIEEMAEDDNRFLVRNAVAILGDLGGDRAIELVTSALANPDPRVRREALKSLVKLESEESGALVLGLLDDADDDVRLAAAVAAGELQVGRALKPLMLTLETSKDPDECLPVIRALGQLGDPGAVNSIEKHAVRSLFNKPRTDVRIAAYRALHQIGTPHARQLLLDVVRDKDEEVKTAVKGMLYSK